jgi:WD40 repeat protein
VISGANDLTARIWDATSGDCTLVLDGENRGLAAAAWSHDSKLIASSFQFQRYGLDASRERSSVLDEVATRTKMTGWRQKGKNKLDGWDFTVWIWCPDTGQLISSFEDLRYPVSAIAWSHDNTRLAAAETSWGGGIKIWNIATGQCLLTVDRPGEEEEKEEGGEEGGGSPKWFAKSLSWSPDESRLALGSDINTVKILDLATKQVISTFEHGHDDKKIISVAWSHDGSRLASGSTENTVKIWDTATGQCIAALAVYSPKNLQFGSSNPNELVTPIGTFELDAIISACGSSDCSAVSPSQPAYDLQGEWITHGGKDFIWLPPDYRPGAWARCGTSLAIGSYLGQVFIVNFAGNKHTSHRT